MSAPNFVKPASGVEKLEVRPRLIRRVSWEAGADVLQRFALPGEFRSSDLSPVGSGGHAATVLADSAASPARARGQIGLQRFNHRLGEWLAPVPADLVLVPFRSVP